MRILTIALVAHDNRKKDLIEWVEFNKGTLANHKLVCTGTTGRMVEAALNQNRKKEELKIEITLLNQVARWRSTIGSVDLRREN